ncbi:MAG: HAD family hydrolase [Clostridia bacterium]
MIRLLAFDLDGTILLNHNEIPRENLKVLEKASAKGVYIVPTTGRIKTFIPTFISDLDFIKYAITANGGGAYNIRTDECLYEASISQSQAIEISKIIEKYNLYVEFYLDGNAHSLKQDVETAMSKHKMPESKRYFLSKKYFYYDNISEFLSNPKNNYQKINLTYVPSNIREEVIKEINKTADLCVTSSICDNIEINHKNATKALGINALCKHLGISKDEVMTIGDGSNDISMLKWAGTSVAMGNAIDEAKAVSKYITDDCINMGFAKAVEKFILG